MTGKSFRKVNDLVMVWDRRQVLSYGALVNFARVQDETS